MHLLMTGGSGFVGKALVSHLAAASHTGTVTSRGPMSGLPSGWQSIFRQEALSSPPPIPPDGVIHLEVKQHVHNPSAAEIDEFEKVNVDGTQNWLDWCSKYGVRRFVYFSSIKAIVSDPHRALAEDTAGPGDSPYGKSKWAGEKRVREWVQADVRRQALILRPSVIYGPSKAGNFFALVDAIARGRYLLVGKNDNVKSIVSIRNVCSAVAHLLALQKPGCEVYHIVDEKNLTVRQIATLVSQQLQIQRSVPTIPKALAIALGKAGDLLSSVGVSFPLTTSRLTALLEHTEYSCAKLKNAGFIHPETTEDGLRTMISWYQSHGK